MATDLDRVQIPSVYLPDYAPIGVFQSEKVFTETTGAGVYTASVTLPAGATLLNIIVHGVALWSASTSATLIVGDAVDDDGYYTAVNLKATDLLAGESLSFEALGGKQGADIVPGTFPAGHVNRRYLATERVISGKVTTVGAAGATGLTRMTVVYSCGVGTAGAATKV